MLMDPWIAAMTLAIGVFLLIVSLTCIWYERTKGKNSKLLAQDPNDWLFYRFHEKIYDAFFKDEPQEDGKVLGLDIAE